jgi:hypothetical protein
LPDRGVVVDVFGHHLDDRREVNERDECRIESLLLGGIGKRGPREASVMGEPVVDVENLLRVGGGSGDLCEERVGIERDGGQ